MIFQKGTIRLSLYFSVGPEVISFGETSFLLSWEKVDVFKRTNKIITGYEILASTAEATFDDFEFYAPGPYGTSYLLTWLPPRVKYTFQVIAVCEGSEKIFSSPVTFIALDSVV